MIRSRDLNKNVKKKKDQDIEIHENLVNTT